jgi:putative membrane protein
MNILKAVITIILFFALLILAILNTNQSVNLNFYQWKTFHDVPLWVVLFGSLAVGIIISAIIGVSEHIKLRLQISRQKKKITELEEEISSLRNIPISQAMEQQEQEIIANKGMFGEQDESEE